MPLSLVIIPISAYLIGSIPFGFLAGKLLKGIDIRDHGSGNPGATNVLRVGGKKAAAITLFGDAIKGVIPVATAQLIGMPPLILALAALAAFLGHLSPVFFNFRGGKGVATAFGVLVALWRSINTLSWALARLAVRDFSHRGFALCTTAK